MDEVAEVSDELMEHYLEGKEISHEETVAALKAGVTDGHHLPGHLRRRHPQPRHQPAARRAGGGPSLTRQEGARSISAGVALEPDEDEEMVAFVFKTLADPFAGRINLFRVYQGVLEHDSQVFNCRAHVQGA